MALITLAEGPISSTELTGSRSFTGIWEPTTAYRINDEVTYNGAYWLCLLANFDTEPSLTEDIWQFVGPTNSLYITGIQVFQGPYDPGTQYEIGNECTYLGDYWLCTSLPPIGTAPGLDTSAYWQLVGSGSVFEGAWDSTGATDYIVGQQVIYTGNLFLCITNNNSTTIPPDDTTDWSPLGGGLKWIGAWSATSFSIGSMVSYGQSVYLATSPAISSDVPAVSSTVWTLIGSQSEFMGAWSFSPPIPYLEGQEVSYGNSVYICISNVTSATPPSSDTTHWQNLSGIEYSGPYDNGRAYAEDESVSYNNNTYLCIAATTAGTLPTNATYWLILGPADASALKGSQLYQGVWSGSNPVPHRHGSGYRRWELLARGQ